MSKQTKLGTIWLMMALILVIAAQCGSAATPATPNPESSADDAASTEASHEHAEDHEPDKAADHEAAETHDHDIENVPIEFAPVTLAEGEKLHVVATTNIIADIVSQIGGEEIDLTGLLPVGADPHTFEPTPQDITLVADAHVVFVNGLGLESFLDEMIANAGGEAVVVPVSHGVAMRQFESDHEEADHHEEDDHEEEHAHHQEDDHEPGEDDHHEEADHYEEHTHDHEGTDPHTWMTPHNVIVFVHHIEQALSGLDSANAATYQANAMAYETELTELDAWVKEQIETIPPENRQLVTDHQSFGYYTDRYGLEQVGAVIPGFSTNASPSAQELAELTEVIGQYGVPAIFVGTTVNSTLAERIAEETDIRIWRLYTGSLGEPGSEVDSYIDFIRYNTTTIVNALRRSE